ncbi:MAG: alkaline phosphatase family protein, partial [Anaerolineaceae bacterium]|nr:alkaline phosphatase family protein [Anaerolineaceae bacterium]
VMESQKLLDAGLFGPGNPMPDIGNRIGDIILLARDNNYLWWSDEENPLTGRHGGLSALDMIVPFVAIPL